MTDIITLTDSESTKIEQARGSAAAVVAAAHDLTVENAEQAERAGGILRDLATVRKRAETDRKALTEPYRAHTQAVNDQYREPSRMLDEADKVIRAKMLTYQGTQERIRAERQAELDRIAAEQRARDEAERTRLAAEAREQREAWEAEAAARNAHAAGHATDETLASAAAAEAAASAMAELERAREIAPLPVRPVETVAAPKPSAGIAVQRPWTFEVTDPSEVPREHLTVSEQSIRQAMREDVRAGREPSPIPGVRFYRDERLAVRGR